MKRLNLAVKHSFDLLVNDTLFQVFLHHTVLVACRALGHVEQFDSFAVAEGMSGKGEREVEIQKRWVGKKAQRYVFTIAFTSTDVDSPSSQHAPQDLQHNTRPCSIPLRHALLL